MHSSSLTRSLVLYVYFVLSWLKLHYYRSYGVFASCDERFTTCIFFSARPLFTIAVRLLPNEKSSSPFVGGF